MSARFELYSVSLAAPAVAGGLSWSSFCNSARIFCTSAEAAGASEAAATVAASVGCIKIPPAMVALPSIGCGICVSFHTSPMRTSSPICTRPGFPAESTMAIAFS